MHIKISGIPCLITSKAYEGSFRQTASLRCSPKRFPGSCYKYFDRPCFCTVPSSQRRHRSWWSGSNSIVLPHSMTSAGIASLPGYFPEGSLSIAIFTSSLVGVVSRSCTTGSLSMTSRAAWDTCMVFPGIKVGLVFYPSLHLFGFVLDDFARFCL